MKKHKKRSRKQILKDKCWKLMSLWVRRRSADFQGYVQCITCGKTYHYKEMNAGHYKHGVLDYDEFNIQPQCVNCNKWNSGRLDKYAEWLLATYGKEKFDDLVIRASMAKKGEPYTEEFLEKLAIDLTVRISEL